MSDRIKQLEQFILEDPSDPFNHYALGLEYINIDWQKALSIFTSIINEHKEYLPVYYQLGKLYVGVGQKENAIHAFSDGIEIAKQKKDLKTLRELNAALQELDED